MELSRILAEIDKEIERLERAKSLLLGDSAKGRRSRSKGPASATAAKKTKKKRNLTPEGRKRIAEAVRRRWELQRKAAHK